MSIRGNEGEVEDQVEDQVVDEAEDEAEDETEDEVVKKPTKGKKVNKPCHKPIPIIDPEQHLFIPGRGKLLKPTILPDGTLTAPTWPRSNPTRHQKKYSTWRLKYLHHLILQPKHDLCEGCTRNEKMNWIGGRIRNPMPGCWTSTADPQGPCGQCIIQSKPCSFDLSTRKIKETNERAQQAQAVLEGFQLELLLNLAGSAARLWKPDSPSAQLVDHYAHVVAILEDKDFEETREIVEWLNGRIEDYRQHYPGGEGGEGMSDEGVEREGGDLEDEDEAEEEAEEEEGSEHNSYYGSSGEDESVPQNSD